jgi:hypothetical protein
VVDVWEDVPVDEIIRNHETIYDDPDPVLRKVIDSPEHMPYIDALGNEIRFFNEAGNKITRREALVYDDQQAGLLLNLRNAHALFDSADVDLYPQAGTRDYGHVQASSVLPGFSKVLRKVNASLSLPNDDDDNDDDDDEELSAHSGAHDAFAVTAQSCQIYGELAHTMSRRAGQHDVQSGLVSGALAGMMSDDYKARARGLTFKARNDIALPQDKAADKLCRNDVKKSLRFENVYVVNMQKLPDTERTGA